MDTYPIDPPIVRDPDPAEVAEEEERRASAALRAVEAVLSDLLATAMDRTFRVDDRGALAADESDRLEAEILAALRERVPAAGRLRVTVNRDHDFMLTREIRCSITDDRDDDDRRADTFPGSPAPDGSPSTYQRRVVAKLETVDPAGYVKVGR